MKLSLVILVGFVFLFSTASGLLSSACRKKSEVCQGSDDCCPVTGVRIVCAPSLEICGKKRCCITEVEEQREKQAAIIRNRNGNRQLKRFWDLILNEDEE